MRADQLFLEKQRKMLLQHLDPSTTCTASGESPLEFVVRVIEEWCFKFERQILPPPGPEERAFWWTLYQLEELEELRMLAPDDPMILFMEDSLERMRLALVERKDIPDGFCATRPYESDEALGLDELDQLDDHPPVAGDQIH